MKNIPVRFVRTAATAIRRWLFPAPAVRPVCVAAESYVGMFKGVIESGTAAPAHQPATASGFVRLEVDTRKKATGCFMFFVEGKVLTGEIDGASRLGGAGVEVSFRLNGRKVIDEEELTPLAAVGRLRLDPGDNQWSPAGQVVASEGEELTIRFT